MTLCWGQGLGGVGLCWDPSQLEREHQRGARPGGAGGDAACRMEQGSSEQAARQGEK